MAIQETYDLMHEELRSIDENLCRMAVTDEQEELEYNYRILLQRLQRVYTCKSKLLRDT